MCLRFGRFPDLLHFVLHLLKPLGGSMVFGKTINQLTVARQLRNYTSFPFNYLQVNKPRQGKCTHILSEQQVVAKLLTVFQK